MQCIRSEVSIEPGPHNAARVSGLNAARFSGLKWALNFVSWLSQLHPFRGFHRQFRGGDIGGAGGAWALHFQRQGAEPPTFTDNNGAPPPTLPVRGILVLTVSDISLTSTIL